MRTPDELKGKNIHTYEDILDKVGKRLKSVEVPPQPRRRDRLSFLKSLYLKRLETAYNIINSEINRIIEVLRIVDEMHPFYKELFKVRTGIEPGDLIKYFKSRKKILRKIYTETIVPIKLSDYEEEVRSRFRGCLGRMLSLLKRKRRTLSLIREAINEISKLPSISDADIKVIVAGMPQVGKSTLVSRLSSAKPEIAHYPFTTKTIIVGHRVISPGMRIAFIDTPGLLDRPLSERNEIELKAVYALKYLADKTIYLFDVSPNAYYSFEEQINVLKDVMKVVGEKPVILCINKIDITPRENIERAKRKLMENFDLEIHEISAYTGKGLDTLLNKIIGDP